MGSSRRRAPVAQGVWPCRRAARESLKDPRAYPADRAALSVSCRPARISCSRAPRGVGCTLPALLGWTSGVIAWAAEVIASASGAIGRAGEARAWGAGVIDWAPGPSAEPTVVGRTRVVVGGVPAVAPAGLRHGGGFLPPLDKGRAGGGGWTSAERGLSRIAAPMA